MECITEWNYLQMMTTDFRPGPLYFFDQPTGRGRRRRPRMPLEHCFDLANGGVRLATIKSLCAHSECVNDDKYEANEDNAHKVQSKPSTTVKPDTWPSVNGALDMGGDERNPEAAAVPADWLDDMDPMDAYKHMAPQLLSELGSVLLQYEGSEEGCIPHGLVNVLNYSWKDLTAGAVYVKPSWQLGVGSGNGDGRKPRKSKGSMNFDETLRQMAGKRKTKQKPSKMENGSERQPQDPNLRKRSSVSHAQKAHVATTISFSISSKTYEEQGWIVQPKEPAHEEPQWTELCHWVVERLQLARIPIKQTTEQAERGLNKPPILRHYGDAKPHVKHQKTGGGSGGGGKTWPYPQIPEVNQEDQDSPRQKLHYRINDGSSFLYYPSGCVAVCQSHSGLSCGGFYTNVFSDQLSPVTLASITAVGRGTVTHPLSGTVTAVWDQRGGMTCDPEGAVTKEWIWQTGVKERIVIQVSDQISVRMLSGICTTLSFKSQNESVLLPLSPLPNITPTKEVACLQTEGAFTSLAAQELSLSKTHQKNQDQPTDSKRVSVRSSEVLQMTREVEKLEEPCPFRRGGGRAGRELKRLQRRICNILDDWLEFYRVATGIKCPDTERMSDGPMRPRLKREGQSAALPSLHPTTGLSDGTRGVPEGGSTASTRHLPLSAPTDVLLPGSTHKLSWTFSPKKQGKEGRQEPLHFTQSGTFRVHSNIRLESVVIPRCSPELRLTAQLPHYTSSSPSTPYPLYSPCPVQLRAILLGLEGRTHRLCRCSSRTMPVLTDQEYDAFIWGQPPHSEQILVVCVTPPHQTPLAPHIPLLPNEDMLELLYEKMNKNRTMPCTQSQLDSFRLVRYELSTGKTCPTTHNALLQQRHNVAPGMFLMYIRGKLLFADYIFNGYSCSARDLHKQISKTRGDYRQGQSLPSDYKFSAQVKSPAVLDPPGHQGTQKVSDGRGDISHGTPAQLEKGKVPN